jgi:hypothetical protein
MAEPIKLKKLEYGLQIIEWLLTTIKNPVYIVNSEISTVNLQYLSLEMFKNKVLRR